MLFIHNVCVQQKSYHSSWHSTHLNHVCLCARLVDCSNISCAHCVCVIFVISFHFSTFALIANRQRHANAE